MKSINDKNFNFFLNNYISKKEGCCSSVDKKRGLLFNRFFKCYSYKYKNRNNFRKINNFENNKNNRYTSEKMNIDLTKLIRKISKSVEKEKLMQANINEKLKVKRKEKSATIEKKKNNIINDIRKIKQNRYEIEKMFKKPKKVINIKHIEINEIDLIIEKKKMMKYHLNDSSSNISFPPLIYSRPLLDIDEPVLIGLNNLGFTCYINALLQCLNQTEPLINYFLSEEGSSKVYKNNIFTKNPSSHMLSPSFHETINNLWDKNNNNKLYSPIYFHQKLMEMNKLFKLNKPNDSKDLLKFILKQLHKELNIKEKKILNNNIKKEFSFDQYDRVKTFNIFLKEFTNNNCSIISNNFFGITEINIQCLNCKDFFINQGIMINPILYDFKIYNVLNFPLEEVRKMKKDIENRKDDEVNNDKINIYDCFEYYQTHKNLNIFCKRCNQTNECIITTKLFNAPNILVLILNRGKGNIYNVKLDYYEEIEISKYIQFKQKKVIYKLYAVLTHLGKSGEDGHFISSCKNLIDHLWYKYNDSSIIKVNDIKKEVFDFGTPYILFYEKE
jgi:ubiquitin C-terminal hydrolase